MSAPLSTRRPERPADDRPPRPTRTTTAASCSSAPTATSTSPPATAAVPATRCGNGQDRTAARQAPADRPAPTGAGRLLDPGRQPVRGLRRRATRSGPTACATRGASVRPVTGALLIGDVGQDAREEVDYVRAPPAAAGSTSAGTAARACIAFDAAPQCAGPVVHRADLRLRPRRGHCAIIGGYVVRDPSLGDLYGRYLFADACVGEIRSLVPGLPRATGERSEGCASARPSSSARTPAGASTSPRWSATSRASSADRSPHARRRRGRRRRRAAALREAPRRRGSPALTAHSVEGSPAPTT